MVSIVKELGDSLSGVKFTFEFEQRSGGRLRSLANKLAPADPDLLGFAFKNGQPVDYVSPKEANKTSILNGGLMHTSGDGRGSSAETIEAWPARLGERNADIDGFAVAVLCKTGFDRIPGCKLDVDNLEPAGYINTFRFSVLSGRTAHVIAGVRKVNGIWQLVDINRGGDVLFWSDVASLAMSGMRTA